MRESQKRAWSYGFRQITRLLCVLAIVIAVLVFLPKEMKKKILNQFEKLKYSLQHTNTAFRDFLWDARMDKAMEEYKHFK